MFPESAAPRQKASEYLVHTYADIPFAELERHNKEIAALKREIDDVTQRFHDLNTKSLIGKVGALILGAVPEEGELELLYKKLRALEADPRFKKSDETIH